MMDSIDTCNCWPGYRHTRKVLPEYRRRLRDKCQVYQVYTASDLQLHLYLYLHLNTYVDDYTVIAILSFS